MTTSCLDSQGLSRAITAQIASFTGCTAASASAEEASAEGTLTFGSDRSYTSSLQLSGGATINVPRSCLSLGGVSVGCTDLNLLLSQAKLGGTANCSSAGDGCVCVLKSAPQTLNGKGTWSTSGNQLSGDGGPAGQYCVRNANTLHLLTQVGFGLAGAPITVNGELVARKR